MLFKKNKGFTLVELLAIIVILAIIALITVPIIMNVVEESREKACELSKSNYIRAVENAILIKNLKTKFYPSECTVQKDGNLECGGEKLIVETQGERPVGGKLNLEDGHVVKETLEFKGNLCLNVEKGNDSSNKCEIMEDGKKVKCNGYDIEIPENPDKDGSGIIPTVPDKDADIVIVENPIEKEGSTCNGTITLYINGVVVNTKTTKKCSNEKIYLSYVNDESVTTYSDGNEGQMYCFQHDETEQVTDSKYLKDCRYIGNNPKNYVSFNGETWRIIGRFWVQNEDEEWQYRYKIIRDEPIVGLQWNKGVTHDWVTASLNTYLNDTWYNNLSDESKEMIGNTKYYIGGLADPLNNSGINYYVGERSYKKSAKLSTVSWIGKIGLMYPSDYVYTFSNDVNYNCFNNNGQCNNSAPNSSWLHKNMHEWTITPLVPSTFQTFILTSAGYLHGNYDTVLSAKNTRPVIYLKSDVKMIGGTGKKDDPYILSR